MLEEVFIALFNVSLFIFAAELVNSALSKYSIPALVGEILIGIVIGPFALGYVLNTVLGFHLINIDGYVKFLAEFSVILVIFSAGLEHGIAPIRSSGVSGFLGATFGALLPFTAAYYIYSPTLGHGEALFLGVAMGATSLAAVAAIIEEERLKGKSINFLVSAAAVDDVVDLLLLSTVIALLGNSSASLSTLAVNTIGVIVLWAVILGVSITVVPRVTNRVNERYIVQFSFLVLFGYVLLMVSLGYSSIISAFVAGVALAASSKSPKIREMSRTLLSLFGPIFFIVTGAEVNLLIFNFKTFLLSLELTGVASLFKWLGVFPFAMLNLRSLKKANTVAIGMIPRGETGLVIASIGLAGGYLGQDVFEAIVFMALFTTLIWSIIFKVLATKTIVG
ncbi:MAG: cation:proton antiporter [Thermoprotei archaeon]